MFNNIGNKFIKICWDLAIVANNLIKVFCTE